MKDLPETLKGGMSKVRARRKVAGRRPAVRKPTIAQLRKNF